MSATEYGPNDTWPTHQKPYWNDALKAAREAGWRLTTGGHTFGKLSCPTGEHTLSVDRTARGGETKAKEVPKRLRQCQHGAVLPTSKVPARKAECELLLARAGELIASAEDDLWRVEQQQHALADLERLALILETADLNVDEVLLSAQDEAIDRAAKLEDAPSQHAIASVIDDASGVLVQAEMVAELIRKAAVSGPLTARATALKACIRALRARLETL